MELSSNKEVFRNHINNFIYILINLRELKYCYNVSLLDPNYKLINTKITAKHLENYECFL